MDPCVGGGNNSDTWWTGGSNVLGQHRTRPKTIHARRPTDFRNAEKVETACKTGLPDERKLGLSEEKDFPITVAAWTREIQKKLEDCGMDTVFLIYDPTKAVQERSLFSDGEM